MTNELEMTEENFDAQTKGEVLKDVCVFDSKRLKGQHRNFQM